MTETRHEVVEGVDDLEPGLLLGTSAENAHWHAEAHEEQLDAIKNPQWITWRG